MNAAKNLVLPATLAYAGVRGSMAFGVTNTWAQIAFGILGAGLGLAIAQRV